MKQVSKYFFQVVFVLEVVSIVFQQSMLGFLAKPLIVPSLLMTYFFHQSVVNRIFVVAMIFCWLGDVFLMFDSANELFFIFGLAAFLLGHVSFTVAYRQLRNKEGAGLNNPQKLRFSFPVLLIGTGLVTILYPVLGDLKVPVMVYALVLTLMVLQSIFRYGFTSSSSFRNICIGALFFLASDSLLAINKFLQPLPNASLLIMVTYMAAQYLITIGALSHKNS